MTLLLQFVALLAGHWVADFVCQSHWMASNKSKDNAALSAHVLIYSAIMLMFAAAIFWGQPFWLILSFVAINGLCHVATDYFTSRWSSRLWAQQRWHDFFVVIGLDQLIHQVTLAILMVLSFRSAA
jgi:hypothetical protein